MNLNTKYNIGDIVDVECLQEEFVPVDAKHKTIEIGVIDEINVSRNGIRYIISLINKDISYSRIKILQLHKKEAPSKILSIEQFVEFSMYNPIPVIDIRTNEKYSSFAFGGNEIKLDNFDTKNELIVKDKEFLDNFQYKVELDEEINNDIYIEGSFEYVVIDTENNEYLVTSNNINRYCEINDVKVKNSAIKQELSYGN